MRLKKPPGTIIPSTTTTSSSLLSLISCIGGTAIKIIIKTYFNTMSTLITLEKITISESAKTIQSLQIR